MNYVRGTLREEIKSPRMGLKKLFFITLGFVSILRIYWHLNPTSGRWDDQRGWHRWWRPGQLWRWVCLKYKEDQRLYYLFSEFVTMMTSKWFVTMYCCELLWLRVAAAETSLHRFYKHNFFLWFPNNNIAILKPKFTNTLVLV